jgi:hypothetical protein
VKVREPVARPLDIVSVELLLSASQAFLVGVLMYLALGIWDDRGVGFGPVAIILALLGAAIGGAWLFWLFGGVGWPLAAANVPTAMFLGFALLLGWQGDVIFRVEGIPALVALAASIYGVVCGVFLDSPRRWRWDQRQKPRAGTTVPRLSPTTQALLAQMPRSMPGHAGASTRRGPGTPWLGQAAPAGDEPGIPYLAGEEPDSAVGAAPRPEGFHAAETLPAEDAPQPDQPPLPPPDRSEGSALDRPAAAMPTERLERLARTPDDTGGVTEPASTAESEPEGQSTTIELPTSLEPKAQRSPWAWAAPPEWNRDEDDTPPRSGASGRS